MSETATNPNDFCYRHPDRRSYILCQRCGRTVCPECQVQAAVGVQCPECVREARQAMPKVRRPVRFGSRSGTPVTYALLAINVVLFVGDLLLGGALYQLMAYTAGLTGVQPWRMLTSAFMHGSILHILFNGYSLLIFGRILEQALGRGRFLALYLLSAFGGSVAVLLLAPNTVVVGASGAIFGLLAAFVVIQRRLGGNAVQILVVLGLNFAMGFLVPGISWQAHLGGAIVGAAVAAILYATRERRQRRAQILALVGVGAALITIAAVGYGLLVG
jgi:membrane associated rhomboid family serine protease